MTKLSQYFEYIGIPPQFIRELIPTIETLFFIVNKHVSTIPYHNIRIFFKEPPVDLSLSALMQRILVEKEGAMCYETAELLYQMLASIGFNIQRVPAFPLQNQPHNPEMPSTHIVLVADINQRLFLIDAGFGYNSLRYPIEFKPNVTSESSIFIGEKYQIIDSGNYYQLNSWQDSNWYSLYRFNKPLEFLDYNRTIESYRNFMTLKTSVPIRDLYIKAGLVTEQGRECFHYEPKQNLKAIAIQKQICMGRETLYEFSNFDIFYEKLTTSLHLKPIPISFNRRTEIMHI